MEKKIAGARKRYGFIKKLAGRFVKRMFNYSASEFDGPKQASVIISNRAARFDAALIALSFKRHVRFISNGRPFRSNALNSLFRAYFKPIITESRITAAPTANAIQASLDAGVSVCVFAETRRTFTGAPSPIMSSIARFVKYSGAPLIMFGISGGYLARPRWAHKARKGKITGRVIRVLSAEQLGAMADEDLYELIKSDISAAASESPQAPCAGKNLAESLETALYMCPGCGGISTVGSHGRLLACSCGWRATYDEMGALSGGRFKTPAEWDKWQQRAFADWVRANQGAYIYDDMFILESVAKNKRKHVSAGVTRLDRDALKIGDFTIRVGDIKSMEINDDNSVDISTTDGLFEMRSSRHTSSRKYVDFYNVIMLSDMD